MTPTEQDNELREAILLEFKNVHRLAPADYTENCTNIVMSLVEAYITANYTANSEVAERERAARIDEIRRTRPHLTYPGMVYYGERMNELRSDETEEI